MFACKRITLVVTVQQSSSVITEGETLGVDILVGSDCYWKLVTGHTIKGAQGPTAVHTKLGWVLPGPVCLGSVENHQRSNLVITHVLKCATDQVSYDGLQGESLGVKPPSVSQEFVETLLYEEDHYEVSLQWKATHPPLPENCELSLRRLQGSRFQFSEVYYQFRGTAGEN